jgi:Uma2 family endonuclease
MEPRLTIADVDLLADDPTKRYELIDGELYVSKPNEWHHQQTCSAVLAVLMRWSNQSGLGVPNYAPGIIFSDEDAVAPDGVWISHEQLSSALWEDGKLHAAPEIVIEVLSPGLANERRDREAKLKLYSRRGVQEYWIIDWRQQQIEIYRREQVALRQVATLFAQDILTSPLLPGFACQVATLFE